MSTEIERIIWHVAVMIVILAVFKHMKRTYDTGLLIGTKKNFAKLEKKQREYDEKMGMKIKRNLSEMESDMEAFASSGAIFKRMIVREVLSFIPTFTILMLIFFACNIDFECYKNFDIAGIFRGIKDLFTIYPFTYTVMKVYTLTYIITDFLAYFGARFL